MTPADAATLVLVRDAAHGLEVFCVERSRSSRFMPGAVVFPGGRCDADDACEEWLGLLSSAVPRTDELGTPTLARALVVTAFRECLEEAAILPVVGTLPDDDLLALRSEVRAGGGALRAALVQRGVQLDAAHLVPCARWVTPAAERRRFDARFFLLRAPDGQTGAPDARETTHSAWATPSAWIERWTAGVIDLAPPTHHTLSWLSAMSSVDEAVAAARARSLEAVHPHLVALDDTWALVLPGDADHPGPERLMEGASRYVLRDGRWLPEHKPHRGVSATVTVDVVGMPVRIKPPGM